MKIALSVINLALKWHLQVPFCNLGHELEHFMHLITGVCHEMYLCFYSKITLKNALCWLHESWGAAPMTTVGNGCACMFALSLQYLLWQHSHALSGVFSWVSDHGESPGLFFARHTCTRMALSMIHCVE